MTSYKNIMEKIERGEKKVYGNINMIDSPPHYNSTEIECIEAIAAATGDGFEYYLQGNIMKYIWRYRYKNGTEDLKKASWYLDKLITEVEGCYDDES
jgi:hypothetical protein|tara:strand:+ start:8799 stop:9089 length:291 start_codon:yes stop_codon:yes gene_type:complete